MPLLAYRSAEIRAALAPVLARVPDGALIVKAAARLASVCATRLRDHRGRVTGARVVLLVGGGNNGGDALLAGARLAARGARVDGLLVADHAYPPGIKALTRSGGATRDCRTVDTTARRLLAAADLVVDGITGLGATGSLHGAAAELATAIPAGTPVVAVDLPSGVDPDTGAAPGLHIHADTTLALTAATPGVLVPPGAYATGRLIVADLGVPLDKATPTVSRLTPHDIADRWPIPQRTDHKYTRGVLGVVAGSDMYPGAAVLACAGAVRAGVGIVRYIGPRRVADHILAARPEVVAGPGKVQAWLLGSGVEQDPDQEKAIDQALGSGEPCIVDAGALEACVRRRSAGLHPASPDRVLLTPHAGELARMLALLGHTVTRADVEAQPLHHVTTLARETETAVLLKGSITLVATPGGLVYSQDTGPAWLATAGAGDVLAGIAGALLAGGVIAAEAGAMAAAVHGHAAAHASRGGPIAAADIADATPTTIARVLGVPPRSHLM